MLISTSFKQAPYQIKQPPSSVKRRSHPEPPPAQERTRIRDQETGRRRQEAFRGPPGMQRETRPVPRTADDRSSPNAGGEYGQLRHQALLRPGRCSKAAADAGGSEGSSKKEVRSNEGGSGGNGQDEEGAEVSFLTATSYF